MFSKQMLKRFSMLSYLRLKLHQFYHRHSLMINAVIFPDVQHLLLKIYFLLCYSADSVEKLKCRLPSLENELKDPNRFKDLYHFTFNYAKNPGQKGLDLDMAITYWNIVLRGRFRFLDLWCQFLQVKFLLNIFLNIYLTMFYAFSIYKGYPKSKLP